MTLPEGMLTTFNDTEHTNEGEVVLSPSDEDVVLADEDVVLADEDVVLSPEDVEPSREPESSTSGLGPRAGRSGWWWRGAVREGQDY